MYGPDVLKSWFQVSTVFEAPTTITDFRTQTISVPYTEVYQQKQITEEPHMLTRSVKVSTVFEAPTTITQYSTIPGSTAVVYSTIRSAYTSTIVSVQPGRTIYETSISTEEGETLTATLSSIQALTVSSCTVPVGPATPAATLTLTRTLPGATFASFLTGATPSCSVPVGPVTPPATITLTRTLPGATLTSFFTAPGFNHSIVQTATVTSLLPGSTVTLPGGSSTVTEFATRTLPGSTSTITSVVNQPGEDNTITSTATETETTTCYETETVSTCNASPTGPASPPRETTVYATHYVTERLPTTTTYTADATCSDSTITITASGGWDKPGTYGPHSSSPTDWDSGKPSGYGPVSNSDDSWDDKPSGYGPASSPTGGWDDKPSGYGGPDAASTKSAESWKRA